MKILTVKEYANRTNRTPDTIRQRAERGTLAGAFKLGGRWYIDADVPDTDRRTLTGKADLAEHKAAAAESMRRVSEVMG